jgi:hypothetical protein
MDRRISGPVDTVGEFKNVRQTSVCQGFRQWTSGGNQRQTEVCRTFPTPFRLTLEFANSIPVAASTRSRREVITPVVVATGVFL